MEPSHQWMDLRSSYTGGFPDRFAGKIPTYYEAKQKSIGFSDTLTLKSHTSFPGKSVGISCRVTGPLIIQSAAICLYVAFTSQTEIALYSYGILWNALQLHRGK